MPRPIATGRRGTRVFPLGWAGDVAAVLERTSHESTVRIGTPGRAGAWDEGARRTVTAGAPAAYEGPATIRPVSDAGSMPVVAQDKVAVMAYEVTLPHLTAGIEAGHVVHVDVSPDAGLVGQVLTVTHVEFGDRHATRLVYATLNG